MPEINMVGIRVRVTFELGNDVSPPSQKLKVRFRVRVTLDLGDCYFKYKC